MLAARADTQALEDRLVAGSRDTDALNARFAAIRDRCTTCHRRFRD
jgi:cytochrome c556